MLSKPAFPNAKRAAAHRINRGSMSARILVIDSSRIVHQTVRLTLSDLAEITALTDAAEAMATPGPWDLAIVSADFGAQLPGIIGGLRSNLPQLRLVVAVGVMKELAAEIQSRLGPCEVVRKPWVGREFRGLVETMLASSPTMATTIDGLDEEPLFEVTESSLAMPLNEEALEAISAVPQPLDHDSPFTDSGEELGFDDMPSTSQFAELMSGVPDAAEEPVEDDGLPPVIDDEAPPIGSLEAEAQSIADDLDAGMNALEASLGDLPEFEATTPPSEARLPPPLVNQVMEMTTPPSGELEELDTALPPAATDQPQVADELLSALPLDEPEPVFSEAKTGEVPPLEELEEHEEHDEDSEVLVWSQEGTSELNDISEPEDFADVAETNASMIAALNALEEAAGFVEEANGMAESGPPTSAEEVLFEEPSALPVASVSALTPEQWIALRAEMRDTVEAMISEIVPQLAERLISAEIERLTKDFEAQPEGDI